MWLIKVILSYPSRFLATPAILECVILIWYSGTKWVKKKNSSNLSKIVSSTIFELQSDYGRIHLHLTDGPSVKRRPYYVIFNLVFGWFRAFNSYMLQVLPRWLALYWCVCRLIYGDFMKPLEVLKGDMTVL